MKQNKTMKQGKEQNNETINQLNKIKPNAIKWNNKAMKQNKTRKTQWNNIKYERIKPYSKKHMKPKAQKT